MTAATATPRSAQRLPDIFAAKHPLAQVSQFVLAWKPDKREVCIDGALIRRFGICSSPDELLTKLDTTASTDPAFCRRHVNGRFIVIDVANTYRIDQGRLT